MRRESLKLPLERFGHSVIEIFNKIEDALLQIIRGGEISSTNQSTHQNTKPAFNLIESGGMFGDINKSDPMAGVAQEGRVSFHRLKDTRLTLNA